MGRGSERAKLEKLLDQFPQIWPALKRYLQTAGSRVRLCWESKRCPPPPTFYSMWYSVVLQRDWPLNAKQLLSHRAPFLRLNKETFGSFTVLVYQRPCSVATPRCQQKSPSQALFLPPMAGQEQESFIRLFTSDLCLSPSSPKVSFPTLTY